MDWVFDVLENGAWVAGGSCPDRDDALREASHYARMYGQDGGDVKAFVYREGERPLFLENILDAAGR